MRNLLLATSLITGVCLPASADERPNILIFLVDDMGLMDTSVPFVTDAQGKPVPQKLNSLYRTPNMEKIAASGVRFSHFYANSVCSPSRISLLNGQFSARHRVTQWINPSRKNAGPAEWNWAGLTDQDVSLQKLFKQAGYTTMHAGKAHLGPFSQMGSDPTKVHFDYNIGGTAMGQPGSYYGTANYGKGKAQVPHLKSYHGTDTFLTEAIALETNKKLTEMVQSGKPFFVQRSHYALHTPFHVDKRFAGNYSNLNISKSAKAFAALVEGMDKSLGDILSHLDSLGEAENTLLIFLGDNGSDAPLGDTFGTYSSAPYKAKKGTCYEGGMLAPFIVSWAKANPANPLQKKFPIKPGIISEKFCTICDIFPTLLTIAELEAPKDHIVDGHDLTSFLSTHKGTHSQKFLMHFPHGHRSSNYTVYRAGDWKLIKHYNENAKKPYELYNLATDPYEKKDLASTNKAQVEKMDAEMQAALKDSNALMGGTNINKKRATKKK